jgi:hypothetical protein
MSATSQSLAATRPMRRTALLAGLLYLLTFVTSIPTLLLYRPLRDHADFVLGAGSAAGVTCGALLEIALAVSCVGTAVVLFPVAKRQSERAALAFLASRVVEACLILVGVIGLLAILRLRHGVAGTAGANADSLITASHTLVAVYDGTFLLGQSLMPVMSALCLGSVLYRSRLVPRIIPAVGLIGAPLLLASDIAIFCGVYPQGAALAGLAALPIAAWEIALGVWLVVKGFQPSPLLLRPEVDAATPDRGSLQQALR